MQIFYTNIIDDETITLQGDEAGHCSRVLRKKAGDDIHVTDGHGNLFSCEILSLTKKEVVANIVETQSNVGKPSLLTVAIAPTKNIARYEWFLEKATEIGIGRVIPILTARSERKIIKPERLEKVLVSAMKQSGNLYKPELLPLTKINGLKEVVDIECKYVAHCMEPNDKLVDLYTTGSASMVLIGPEGDFTPEELEMLENEGFVGVSLGNSRLRTETAGIVACHTVALKETMI